MLAATLILSACEDDLTAEQAPALACGGDELSQERRHAVLQAETGDNIG